MGQLCLFCVNFVLSILVSAVAHLLIEAPIAHLHKLYLSDCLRCANVLLVPQSKDRRKEGETASSTGSCSELCSKLPDDGHSRLRQQRTSGPKITVTSL